MGRKRGVKAKCGYPACEKPNHAKGLCKKHYNSNYYRLYTKKKAAKAE